MRERETTVRSRELGAAIRRVIEDAGLYNKDVARQIGWSEAEFSRMLNGKRNIKEGDVGTILGICGVTGQRRLEILELCREANKKGWHQQHGSRLPPQLRTYIDHEDNATAITDYQAAFLPGSLQTFDYAHAVISRIATIPASEVKDRVSA